MLHDFLIGVELCLSFIFTIQLSLLIKGPMDLESVWLRVNLGTSSLDSVNISKTFAYSWVLTKIGQTISDFYRGECVSYNKKSI